MINGLTLFSHFGVWFIIILRYSMAVVLRVCVCGRRVLRKISEEGIRISAQGSESLVRIILSSTAIAHRYYICIR